jgi:DNA helicase IV
MHADLAAEQRHLDRAHEHLAAMRARVSGLVDVLAVDARSDVDAATARHQLQGYRTALDGGRGPLCFGRIDNDDGERWYVGRRHVEDDHGDPVVVDWRAGVAIPFYRATFRDPLGLHLRRRFVLEDRELVGIFDEDFDDPDSAHHATGVADPLLAELDRARTGEMRDIVATIQAEQDVVIRAPLDQLLIVQGGPGTGKTAVGLHRAALLLYDHRDLLERDGVLIVGPNRTFLRYISQVLPSLGETAVIQTTLAGLGSVDVRAAEPDDVAALKGDPRLAEVIARAAWERIAAVTEPLEARTRFGTIRLDVGEVEDRRRLALSERRSVESSRTRFRNEIVALAQRRLLERRPEGLKIEDDVHHAVRTSPELRRAIDRLWPATTGAALVRRLLTSPAFLRRFATDVLDAGEQRLLGRKGARRRDDEPWTLADVPLVDEAEAVLGVRHRRFGHLVVDEAQDLSPMAWRVLARRCSRFPSMTVLGDLAQATAPAAQRSWRDVVISLGQPAALHEAELEIGYRVPGQILDVANRLLPATGAAVRPSRSVRTTPVAPRFVPADPDQWAGEVVLATRELLDRYASVAVIGADLPSIDGTPIDVTDGLTDRVTVLGAADAKGLEFDAVVVLEPAAFLSHGERGARLLYIAMTRAVQELVVVHAERLPPALAEPAMSAKMAG